MCFVIDIKSVVTPKFENPCYPRDTKQAGFFFDLNLIRFGITELYFICLQLTQEESAFKSEVKEPFSSCVFTSLSQNEFITSPLSFLNQTHFHTGRGGGGGRVLPTMAYAGSRGGLPEMGTFIRVQVYKIDIKGQGFHKLRYIKG